MTVEKRRTRADYMRQLRYSWPPRHPALIWRIVKPLSTASNRSAAELFRREIRWLGLQEAIEIEREREKLRAMGYTDCDFHFAKLFGLPERPRRGVYDGA